MHLSRPSLRNNTLTCFYISSWYPHSFGHFVVGRLLVCSFVHMRLHSLWQKMEMPEGTAHNEHNTDPVATRLPFHDEAWVLDPRQHDNMLNSIVESPEFHLFGLVGKGPFVSSGHKCLRTDTCLK